MPEEEGKQKVIDTFDVQFDPTSTARIELYYKGEKVKEFRGRG